MTVPDAAIEAAAEALWGDFVKGDSHYPNFSDYPKKDQDYWRHDARVAIEAAMPAIREHIADEIESDAGFNEHPWKVGMTRARLIVRSGTPS